VATLESGFWKRRFDGARRLVHALPEFVPTRVTEATAAPADFGLAAAEAPLP
jgi:hypothetical protein